MILALDTATIVSSIALVQKDRLVAEITINTNKHHSELLMPHIADIFRLAKVDKKNLTGVAVSIGPGSFTGLRIGLATAKTLAYALSIPIVGVPTLEALAFGCLAPNAVISPLLDAQKGNVYQGLYHWQQGELTALKPPQVVPFDTALAQLIDAGRPAIVLGDAAVMYADKINSIESNVILAPPQMVLPQAANVAILGQRLLAQGRRDDVLTLEPYYIRRSEAEELWERRQARCDRL